MASWVQTICSSDVLGTYPFPHDARKQANATAKIAGSSPLMKNGRGGASSVSPLLDVVFEHIVGHHLRAPSENEARLLSVDINPA